MNDPKHSANNRTPDNHDLPNPPLDQLDNQREDQVMAEFTDMFLSGRTARATGELPMIVPDANARDEQSRLKRIVAALDGLLNEPPSQPPDTLTFDLKRKLQAEYDLVFQRRRAARTRNLTIAGIAAALVVGFLVVISGALQTNPNTVVGTAIGNLGGETVILGFVVIAVVGLGIYLAVRRR